MFIFLCLIYLLLIIVSLILLFLVASHLDKNAILKYYDWYKPSFLRKCRMLPSPSYDMIFGMGFQLMKKGRKGLWDFFRQMIDNVGDIGFFTVLGAPNIYIMSVDDIEALFTAKHCISKGREYRFLTPWLGDGLLTSTGSKWHFRRKLLTPTFHFKILENFVPIFNKNATLLVEKLTADSTEHSSPVNIGPLISICALSIICARTAEIMLERTLAFWMYLNCVFYCLPIGREYKKLLGKMHAFTGKIIRERKENYQPMNHSAISSDDDTSIYKRRVSFLDCLIEYQKENPTLMTDEDIREEVDTFTFEGHDTVSATITWALFAIATHPEVQNKLQEELEQIFGNSLRDITHQDINNMQYLDMVLKESLRLYPAVPAFSREIDSDLQLKNHCIPAGMEVFVIPYLLHRDPRLYPEPEKFDPDRFLPDVAKTRHAYAYIPFSAGFRNCIGQKYAVLEAKIILATILRTLRVSTTLKKEDVVGIPGLILRPFPNITLSFSPIKC